MKRDPSFVHEYLRMFSLPDQDGQTTLQLDQTTRCDTVCINGAEFCRYTNEFWTADRKSVV